MHHSLRNLPAERASKGKGRAWARLLAVVVLLATAGVPAAAQAFTVYFDQSAYTRDVWLQVQDPNYASTTTNFQATYAGGTQSIDFDNGGSNVLMSVPVKLSDIGSGGLTVTYSNSAVLFIYYDDPSGNSRTAAPAHMTSTQRFQPFELTMTGGDGDQGNLTAINYFTAPLSIKSYENDPAQNASEPVLQQTGYTTTAAQVGKLLAQALGDQPTGVITNAGGQIIRYIGPSNFTGISNPWPSFIPYTQSINAANQTTHILRSNSFNFAAPHDTPVYQFGADMTATANADGSLTVTGSITAATISGSTIPPNPSLPANNEWTDATLTFSVSSVDDFNNAIYGQTQTAAVTTPGQGWIDFKAFTDSTLMIPDGDRQPYPAQANYNPSLTDIGAYDTTLRMFIGEVTTGLLGGFFNSSYEVGGQAIKDMDSNVWWSLDPIVAFSEIQPANPYYNTYANVIFNTSNNTVYGVPYSDRFGQGPLVNTVNLNGTPVNYWVVGIGAPLSGAPSIAPMALLLL